MTIDLGRLESPMCQGRKDGKIEPLVGTLLYRQTACRSPFVSMSAYTTITLRKYFRINSEFNPGIALFMGKEG